MEYKVSFPTAIFSKHLGFKAFGFLVLFGCLGPGSARDAQATTFSREQDIVDLKLGQRVKVDDGTCPAGQVKEVSGSKMTESGVVHARKCIPRLGIKQK